LPKILLICDEEDTIDVPGAHKNTMSNCNSRSLSTDGNVEKTLIDRELLSKPNLIYSWHEPII